MIFSHETPESWTAAYRAAHSAELRRARDIERLSNSERAVYESMKNCRHILDIMNKHVVNISHGSLYVDSINKDIIDLIERKKDAGFVKRKMIDSKLTRLTRERDEQRQKDKTDLVKSVVRVRELAAEFDSKCGLH